MITQIVRLKQVVKRWKNRSVLSYSSSDSDEPGSVHRGCTPSGSLAVYVGHERRRFVIPTRFLYLPVFISLLDKAEEEFGFQPSGGLVLPCEVEFFMKILKLLDMDEHRYGVLGLDEIVMVINDVGFESCKEAALNGFVPLVQNARV
ncbi:hypothetical protein K7X08_000974 [Anisodus acutangulus]|uniref:Small auxin up regulated protein n=1 Tax=Anisodus acutangulus TaxID=402998 RepID=A0A9Q1RMK3_9SOLA|nr:hypothetical protein K7X08_000974 [Anisodus acutangulus]